MRPLGQATISRVRFCLAKTRLPCPANFDKPGSTFISQFASRVPVGQVRGPTPLGGISDGFVVYNAVVVIRLSTPRRRAFTHEARKFAGAGHKKRWPTLQGFSRQRTVEKTRLIRLLLASLFFSENGPIRCAKLCVYDFARGFRLVILHGPGGAGRPVYGLHL